MEPAAQQTMKQMIQAASDPNGFMHPKLMEELGFEKMGETGEIPIYATGQDAAGNLIPATAADVAVRAKLMYGIDPTQAFQPTIQPGSGEIQTANGNITSADGQITGRQEPSLLAGVSRDTNGSIVSSVGRDADGIIAQLSDGSVVSEKSAAAIIKVMESKGNIDNANALRESFGIPEQKAPDAPNRTPVQPLSEGAETLFNNLTPKAEAKLKKAYEKSNKAKEPDWILDALKTLNDEFTNAKLSPKQAAALDKFVGGLLTKKGNK